MPQLDLLKSPSATSPLASSKEAQKDETPVIRYSRSALLKLSKKDSVAKAGDKIEGMPDFKTWFGEFHSSSSARREQFAQSTDRTRSAATGSPHLNTKSPLQRDRPPHTSFTARAGTGAIGDSGASRMGSFRHQGGRVLINGDRDGKPKDDEKERDKDEGDGLKKLSDTYDKERDRDSTRLNSRSWATRGSEKERLRDSGADDKHDKRDGDRRGGKDGDWSSTGDSRDWRSRGAASLPIRPSESFPAKPSGSNAHSSSSSNSRVPGRPAWNPAPPLRERDSADRRDSRRDRNTFGGRDDDEDEVPAWMTETSSSPAPPPGLTTKEGAKGKKDDLLTALASSTITSNEKEDEIQRFKREMRERDALRNPAARTPTSTTNSQPTESDSPKPTNRPPLISVKSTPSVTQAKPTLLPLSSGPKPDVVSASVPVTPGESTLQNGESRRAPGGSSRFKKFFDERGKGVPVGAPGSVASANAGATAVDTAGLMGLLTGNGGAGGSGGDHQMNKLLAMLQNSTPSPGQATSPLLLPSQPTLEPPTQQPQAQSSPAFEPAWPQGRTSFTNTNLQAQRDREQQLLAQKEREQLHLQQQQMQRAAGVPANNPLQHLYSQLQQPSLVYPPRGGPPPPPPLPPQPPHSGHPNQPLSRFYPGQGQMTQQRFDLDQQLAQREQHLQHLPDGGVSGNINPGGRIDPRSARYEQGPSNGQTGYSIAELRQLQQMPSGGNLTGVGGVRGPISHPAGHQQPLQEGRDSPGSSLHGPSGAFSYASPPSAASRPAGVLPSMAGPASSGSLPPPNAAEIQNHLLRQMMLNVTGSGVGGDEPEPARTKA
ncbi:hypothetical protein [Phaffia rhodozyma]|uniref:Uncharacterized protein n=1 Tax=Phaffia rhodozyma TaxID=264483 RepID=A0A0F7SEP5_PHARH|nr:hypothetical protein [Phaffia rhodozyma]